jgi:hypothetical protein
MIAFHLVLVVWVLVLLVGAWLVEQMWSRGLSKPKFHFLIVPGVALRALVQTVACALMAAKVKEVKPFGGEGEYVSHEKPKVPVISGPFIALAPVVVAFILMPLLMGVGGLFDDPLNLSGGTAVEHNEEHNVEVEATAASFIDELGIFFVGVWDEIADTVLSIPETWRGRGFGFMDFVGIYVGVSMILALAPSKSEGSGLAAGIPLLGVLVVALSALVAWIWGDDRAFQASLSGAISYSAVYLALGAMLSVVPAGILWYTNKQKQAN